MNLTDWRDVITILGIGGIIGGGKLIYGVCIKLNDRRKMKLKLIQQLTDDITTIKPMVKRVFDEVTPNGSQSLKDQVTRIDNNLHFHQNIHRATLNGLGVAYWVSNELGHCIEASDGLCRILDRRESDILGNNWSSWIIPEQRNAVYDEWIAATKDNRKFDMVYTFMKPNNSRVTVRGIATPIVGKNHNLAGFFGYIKEISTDEHKD